jgi:hypothetical protein
MLLLAEACGVLPNKHAFADNAKAWHPSHEIMAQRVIALPWGLRVC